MTLSGRAAILGILGVPALAIAASCTIFNGLVADGPDAGGREAGVDAGCALHHPPSPRLDAPNGGGVSFAVVTTRFRFGAGDAGFDLDDSCTCLPEEAGSCVPPSGGTVVCDGDGGIDNAGADVAVTYKQILEEFANGRLRAGDGNILLRIDDYNGGPDDEKVRITIYRSQGPMVDAGRGCAPTGYVKEVVDASAIQEWSIDENAIENLNFCTASQTGDGYVVNRQLVARVKTTLSVHPFIEFGQSGVVTGKVVEREAGIWSLEDVVVAGRWNADLALRSLGRYEVDLGAGSSPLCENPDYRMGILDPIRPELCAARDVADIADLDHKEGSRCTAVSTVLLLDTAPAWLGPTVSAASIPSVDCPEEAVRCP
jgi:hypothetical protein